MRHFKEANCDTSADWDLNRMVEVQSDIYLVTFIYTGWNSQWDLGSHLQGVPVWEDIRRWSTGSDLCSVSNNVWNFQKQQFFLTKASAMDVETKGEKVRPLRHLWLLIDGHPNTSLPPYSSSDHEHMPRAWVPILGKDDESESDTARRNTWLSLERGASNSSHTFQVTWPGNAEVRWPPAPSLPVLG